MLKGGAAVDNFTLAKERLDIVEVARDHFRLNHNNMACCPWHTDKTPSLHFKQKTQRFICYGCGVHGDVIDFMCALSNLEPLEALKELNQTYGLGLDLGTPVPKSVILEAHRRRKQKKLFEEWERAAFKILAAYFHTLRDWREDYRPKSPGEPLDPRFIESLNQLDYIDYVLDTVFITGSRELKAEYVNVNEQMIRHIEQRLIWEGVPYAGRNGTGDTPAPQFQPTAIMGGPATGRAA
jgi:hypothetical protein